MTLKNVPHLGSEIALNKTKKKIKIKSLDGN